MFIRAAALLAVGLLAVTGCSTGDRTPAGTPALTSEPFGSVGPTPVTRYTLSNGRGMRVRILNYGGIIQSMEVPDRNGKAGNVVLGFPALQGYLEHSGSYFGGLVGRFANRIAKGTFSLNDRTYSVPVNNHGNSLHGGTFGFDQKVWEAKEIHGKDTVGLQLRLVSPDGDMGYPGTLGVTVDYTVDTENRLRIDYRAETDAATVVNLSNHSYWNLAGESAGTVYAHKLTIHADRYNPTDATQIPTGPPVPVAGTPFDFTQTTRIGEHIAQNDVQLLTGQGYDHNWVLNRADDHSMVSAVRVEDPVSGRTLQVSTTEPGMQFYSGNFLDGTMVGTGGRTYRQSAGFVLEPQHFPDSPNRPDFPSTVLNPGQVYRQTSIFQLGVG